MYSLLDFRYILQLGKATRLLSIENRLFVHHCAFLEFHYVAIKKHVYYSIYRYLAVAF